ncbi:MAG: transporter substrate-binding domain-containing protein [Alteromonadaceae bacterium]|nr:transporter substrate-binding domain-containing protein [Alteromonadaceae bacterium]
MLYLSEYLLGVLPKIPVIDIVMFIKEVQNKSVRYYRCLILVLCALVLSAKSYANQEYTSPINIVHPGEHHEGDYTLELLAKALNAGGNKYQAVPLGHYPPRGRDFLMMEKNEGIDIMWGTARADREARFLPIRLPIFRGLIGWRIPLVKQEKIDLFKGVSTLEQLSRYRPGQHFRWTDTRILKDNGINVFEVNNHGSIMGMLVADKFDYYPRAAIEIEGEYALSKDQGVVIDPHVLIIYPTAFYFYVRKDNQALAKNLTDGLEKLIQSGEMNQLFEKHFSNILNTLAIDNRNVIRLDNQYLPEKAPLDRPELWLDPAALDAAQ